MGRGPGTPVHTSLIGAIAAAVGGEVRVEAAGGLRTADAVRAVLASGAARAVVGTAALRDPAFAGALVEEHGPERVAVAIDVRDGQAVGSGWVASAPGPDALDAIALLADRGVTTFEVTAIDRDGLLQGPDLDLFGRAVALGRGRIIASAGITSRKDVASVRAIGCAGAIIGRALYEGQLSLQDALVGRGIRLTRSGSSHDAAEAAIPAKFPRVERWARCEAAIGPFQPNSCRIRGQILTR